MAKKQRKNRRHPYMITIEGDGLTRKPAPVWAQIVDAKTPVEITLTAATVRRSIKLNGRGSTQRCPGSLCVKEHQGLFPHKTEGGFVDWLYSKCFVSSKVNKHGLPVKCVRYDHNTSFAQLQDLFGGPQQLLEKIERDGPITIRLLPPTRTQQSRAGQPVGRPRGNRDGTRTPRAVHKLGGLKGARRRMAAMTL